MNTVFQFLDGLSAFFNSIFKFDVLPGIDLFTVLFYNLMLIVVFTAFVRR